MVNREMVIIYSLCMCTVLVMSFIFIQPILATDYSSYDGTYFSADYPTTWQVDGNNTSLNLSDESTGHYVYIKTDEDYPTIAILNNYSTLVNGSLDDATIHLLKTLRFKSKAIVYGVNNTENSDDTEVINNSQTENVSTWNDKGVDFYIRGIYSKALECYDNAINMDPNYSQAWNNKGAVFFIQGRYDAAIQAYDRAIEINPRYASAWNNKGSAQYNLGKYEEAIKSFDRAIYLNPKNANAWYNKSKALKKLGKNSDAESAYSKAKELGYTA